jgi:hypothetical protein
MKQASVSSTDQGGGKRRAEGLEKSSVACGPHQRPQLGRGGLWAVVLSAQQVRLGEVHRHAPKRAELGRFWTTIKCPSSETSIP